MEQNFDFLSLAKSRYSVRKFTDEKVSDEHLNLILKAGHLAPTGCNNQPQRILVINKPESIEKLKKCTKCHFDTTTALLVCYNKNECWKRSFDGETSGRIDASIVATHMMLEAHALGVGSTWVMFFDPAAMRTEFNIPQEIEPVALLVMGYPAADAKPFPGHTEFKKLDDIVIHDTF